jgi:hypothetical protein
MRNRLAREAGVRVLIVEAADHITLSVPGIAGWTLTPDVLAQLRERV